MATPEQRAKRRRIWFERGADAVERSIYFDLPPHHRRLYCCPLCSDFHTIDSLDTKELTEEHVPPRALGGKPMVLTCAECNHTAGTAIDAHAASQKKVSDLLSLRRGSGPVLLDHNVNAHLTVPDGGGAHFGIDIRRNNPINLAKFETQMQRRYTLARAGALNTPITGFAVRLRHDERKANLSYLRAAYLTAFAHYGYRLVLGDSYSPIHAQLRTPERQIIKRLVVGNTFPGTPAESGISQGRIKGLGSLLTVRFDTRWVGLPSSSGDTAWWDRAATLPSSAKLYVKDFQPLPTRPWHHSDLADRPSSGDWHRLDFYGDHTD